jgi:hypothetical protein
MHNPTHNQHINGLLILIATLLVGGLLWYIIASSTDTYNAPASVAVVPESNEGLYTNDIYGFSLRYDKRLTLHSDKENNDFYWRYNTTTPGKRIVTLSLPRDFLPGTNFSEGVVSVGASDNASALNNCLVADNGEEEETGTVPEPTFKVFTQTGAGAGNFYEVRSYRTLRNGYCISLERMIHSTNVLNYDVNQNIREFDRAMVEDILDRVVNSFNFK